MGDHALGIFWVAQQTGNVAHEYQPPGLEGDGCLRRRHVRVAIVSLAVLAQRRRADDRRDAAPDALAQWLGVHRRHFADETEVEVLAGRVLEKKFFALENFREQNVPYALCPLWSLRRFKAILAIPGRILP